MIIFQKAFSLSHGTHLVGKISNHLSILLSIRRLSNGFTIPDRCAVWRHRRRDARRPACKPHLESNTLLPVKRIAGAEHRSLPGNRDAAFQTSANRSALPSRLCGMAPARSRVLGFNVHVHRSHLFLSGLISSSGDPLLSLPFLQLQYSIELRVCQ